MTFVDIDSKKRDHHYYILVTWCPQFSCKCLKTWENICKKFEDYESLQYSCKCLKRWANIYKEFVDYNKHHLALLSIGIIVDIVQAKYDRVP